MDPLSISASIIAIITLSAQLGSKLKKIVEDNKDAPSELTEIRDEVISLTWFIESLRALVEEEQRTPPNQVTLWSRALDGQGTQDPDIELALKSCKNIMKILDHKVDTMEGYLNGGPLDRMKYTLLVSSERSNLKDLRVRLAHSKNSIVVLLQLRTLALVKTNSAADIEHHAAIQKLLKLVQAVKIDDKEMSLIKESEPSTKTSTLLPELLAISAPPDDNDLSPSGRNSAGAFDLEVYSTPDAWLNRFRS